MPIPKELLAGAKAERFFQVDQTRSSLDVERRTVELSFASECPYERYWGIEILDLGKKSVDLTRLKSGGPLLVDHDTRDQVGVIESVRIDADRVGRAVVRFGKSKRADEVFQDVVDGIRSNVSVGYQIKSVILESEKDGLATYRVSEWLPYEISLVSVPADATVGVDRADSESQSSEPIIIKEKVMPNQDQVIQDHRSAGADSERKRVADILTIGDAYKNRGISEIAVQAVRDGTSLEDFKTRALEKLCAEPKPVADIGLDKKEVKRYSMLRALNALANPGDRKTREAAAFEIECSDAAAQRAGKVSQGLMVPYDVLKRDLLVTTATAGGHTVQTELQSANFIDLLRNAQIINSMGVTNLTGLQGNIAIPRQSGANTAYWVGENTAVTESQQAFDQVTMSPKSVGAFTDISRKLLIQSSIDVENFVQKDLATVLGLAIQSVAIKGGGTNEPLGILSIGGIGSVVGGANGLAPAWSHIVDLETAIAIVNADVGNMGYLINAKARGAFKKSFINGVGSPAIWSQGSQPLNGYQVGVTNAVPANLTKGSSSGICSAMIFGNFADLIIGYWGGLDLLVDPFTGGAAGTVRVRVLQDVDVAVRHPESFAAMLDALV